MRLLIRTQMILEGVKHRIDTIHCPILALILKRRFALPQFEHDVERFKGHLTVFTGRTIDIEQFPITGESTGPNTQHDASLGHVVEEGNAVRQLCWMMIWQQMCAWT